VGHGMFHAEGKIELLMPWCKTSEDFTRSLSTYSNTKKLITCFFMWTFPSSLLSDCMLKDIHHVGIEGDLSQNLSVTWGALWCTLFPYSFAITVGRIMNYFF